MVLPSVISHCSITPVRFPQSYVLVLEALVRQTMGDPRCEAGRAFWQVPWRDLLCDIGGEQMRERCIHTDRLYYLVDSQANGEPKCSSNGLDETFNLKNGARGCVRPRVPRHS